MPTRDEVYEAIDTERDYQDGLERNEVNRPGNVMENLAIIEEVITRMKKEFYDKPGYPNPAYMRKIAATAVRTMEEYGAPHREAT